MIPQSVKPVKQLGKNSEISLDKKKSRHPSKTNLNTRKTKPDVLSSSKSSSGSFSSHVSSKGCINRLKENDSMELKLALMDFTPSNRTNIASQGVKDFIHQVSKYIEKKNPFRVIPEGKCSPGSVKLKNALKNQELRNDPRIYSFDKKTASDKPKKHPEIPKALQKPKKLSEGIQVSKSKAVVSPGTGVQRGPLNSPPEDGKPSDSTRIRRYVDVGNHGKTELKGKHSLRVVASRSKLQDWNNAEAPSSLPLSRPKVNKRPGRSEIPLRKTRTDMSKNPKPLSLLLQRPLKDIESTISIDSYSKKPFTPIEEISPSENQNLNVTGSSEKLSHVDTKSSPRILENEDVLEEVCNGFKLDRCFKSANIPVDFNPSYSDASEQKLCVAKRSRILDLAKVRTYSFTVLQNSREALCRLESLHQQNVSTKESVFGEKISSSKLKILSPKSSFNSLKGKGSKKNLSSRLSSKGNKPALKVKARKSKKDLDESAVLLKKIKNKTPQPDVSQKVTVSSDPSVYPSSFWKDEENQKAGESDSGILSGDYKKTTSEEEMSSRLIPEAALNEFEKDFKIPRNSGKKLASHFDDKEVDQNKSKEKIGIITSPPYSPDFITSMLPAMESTSPEDRQTDEDERSSSKTVTLGKPGLEEVSSVSSEDSPLKSYSHLKTVSKASHSTGLTVKGTSLKIGDEPPEKPEESEPKKNKLHIKINLTSPEDTDYEENGNEAEDLERLFVNDEREDDGERSPSEKDSKGVRDKQQMNIKHTLAPHVLSRETKEKESLIPSLQKSRKSSPFLKSRLQYKVSGVSLKGVRKKKTRSDAGDRRLPSSTGFFKSVSFQNKMKLDTKLRSGLTKAYIREEKRDLFDDNVPIKLKRRNSEPVSFRGYIWKRADSVTPRDHKASVSSMASSLKHLNTDDIDDFIFWEAVPQKMTACWEMSLYHSKRPWSVLSCSVFEDNRQSSTPGLILENLRNGGSLGPRRSPLNLNERASRNKDNPFDVEPSIAQKNIDIRNWLAALNFPTPPSTSVDVISEGNFPTEPFLDAKNLTKGQVNQKRRKVLASLRFSEETTEKKPGEKQKYKKSSKWDATEVGGFMDLIRRKSGGFVTNEQFLNSEHSIHRPNVTVNLCLYSKTPEEKPALREDSDKNVSSELNILKTPSKSPSSEVKPARPTAEIESLLPQDAGAKMSEEQQFYWARVLKGELALLPSDLNIWKYLFLLTLLIISVHYCFLNNGVGSS